MENSAKQKAVEIVEKYLPHIRGADRYSYNLDEINLHIAKQCALIAVDEMIKGIRTLHKPEYVTFYEDKFCEQMDGLEKYEFWQQVRSEIEKL